MTHRRSSAKEKPSRMEFAIKIVFRLLPIVLILILLIVQLQNNKRVKAIQDRLEVVEHLDDKIDDMKGDVLNLSQTLNASVIQSSDEITTDEQIESDVNNYEVVNTVKQTVSVTQETSPQNSESMFSSDTEKPIKKGFFKRLFSIFKSNK